MVRLQPGDIAVLHFGGQYAHLIATQFRQQVGVTTKLVPADTPLSDLMLASGIVLSGSPSSVYDVNCPQPCRGIFDLSVPILGICYGMGLIGQHHGGQVKKGRHGQFGPAIVNKIASNDLLDHEVQQVWMSHGDQLTKLPANFHCIASSDSCKFAAIAHNTKPCFGLQFHPEVTDTTNGLDHLTKFAALCDTVPYTMTDYKAHLIAQIKEQVGNRRVFMLTSGGVDSTVAFKLLTLALGDDRVSGLLIDTGLMRQGEIQGIQDSLMDMGIKNVITEDTSARFFSALAGVADPQQKRQIIGQVFVETFLAVAKRTKRIPGDRWMIGQGTLYPDTVESGSAEHADQIKLHHNMHSLIAAYRRQGWVVEPLRELYKDGVRELAAELNLPPAVTSRHPFPGPGLGVRILCAKWPNHFKHLDRLWRAALWPSIAPVHMILPVRSVGVKGDQRSYARAISFFLSDQETLTDIVGLATDTLNRVPQLNRALVCLSHGHPFTLHVSRSFVTRDRADLLCQANAIVNEEVIRASLYDEIWQFPVVLLPCGAAPGGQSIVLRPVNSENAMTATPHLLPQSVYQAINKRLLALDGIDVVFCDLTSKPPGTIEWE